MKIRNKVCPWCGAELTNSNQYHGECEHCGNKCKGVVRYSMRRRYYKQEVVGQEETSKKETPL